MLRLLAAVVLCSGCYLSHEIWSDAGPDAGREAGRDVGGTDAPGCDAGHPCETDSVCTEGTTNCRGECVERFVVAECRPARGPCDAAEICTGESRFCPADSFRSASTVCRPAEGICDVAETCMGSSSDCPEDQVAPPDVVCRAADPTCPTVFCDGRDKECPPIACP